MSGLDLDEGLRRRLAEAGRGIVWGPARNGRNARRARLRDEEARVEQEERGGSVTVEVAAGPLGALILLLEADRRGPPSSLGSRNAGRAGSFPDGSIVASWGPGKLRADARPTIRDLVDLARYALR